MTEKGRKRTLRLAVPAFALVAVAVLAVLARGNTKPAGPVIETATVMRGALKLSIATAGQFQASKSVAINPDISGQATLTYLAPEGIDVREGDVIARMTGDQWEDRLDQYQMQVENDANDVTQGEESLKILKSTNATDLATKKTALDMAKIDAAKYGEVLLTPDGEIDEEAYKRPDAPPQGDAYQAFRDALLNIRRAETGVERAQTDFDGQDKLLEKGFISKSDYLTSELALREAWRKLDAAKVAYHVLATYTYPQTLMQKKQAVAEAQNDYDTAQLRASVKINQAETGVRYQQRAYLRHQERLDMCNAELAKRVVTSPVSGVIIYGDPEQPWMKDRIAIGSPVFRGLRLFTIPDLSKIIVTARVLEMDVYNIAVGQQVDVTVQAIPGLMLHGKVTKIGEYASEDQHAPSSRGAKTFDIVITMDGTDPRVKPGMTCDAEIINDIIPDALYVPVTSVYSKGDTRVCYVLDGEVEREVPVETGRASEKYVEITSGLEPGEKVVVAPATPKTPSTSGGA